MRAHSAFLQYPALDRVLVLRFDIGRGAAIVARAHALREAVFVTEQKIAPAEEWDGLDEEAVHFIAVDAETGRDIGTGRAILSDGMAKLQRIAVLREARGKRGGFALVADMLGWARGQPGTHSAVLGAQCYAIPFYEKLGFEAFGPVYDDAGIPHRQMRRAL